MKIQKIFNNNEHFIVVVVEQTKEELKETNSIYLPNSTRIEKCIVLYDLIKNKSYLTGNAPVKWILNTLLINLSANDYEKLCPSLLNHLLDLKEELNILKEELNILKENNNNIDTNIVHIDSGEPVTKNKVIQTYVDKIKDEVKQELNEQKISKIVKLYRDGKMNPVLRYMSHYVNPEFHSLFGIKVNEILDRTKMICSSEQSIISHLRRHKVPVKQIALFIDRTYDQVAYNIKKNKKRLIN